MYYSPTIGGINLYDRWGLMPLARPWFNPPPVKTTIIEVPGASGVVDLTEALTGAPTYGNREGEWTFVVDRNKNQKPWNETYSEILAELHGKFLQCYLEDEPNWYYEGRFSVTNYTSYTDGSGQGYTISYSVGPYKKSKTGNNKSL